MEQAMTSEAWAVLGRASLPSPLVFLPPWCGKHSPEWEVGLLLGSGLWDKIGGADPTHLAAQAQTSQARTSSSIANAKSHE